jgi:hypothetical protein
MAGTERKETKGKTQGRDTDGDIDGETGRNSKSGRARQKWIDTGGDSEEDRGRLIMGKRKRGVNATEEVGEE